MTTVVRKGQNRAKAEAAREKHAQRTPLPMLDIPKEIAPVIIKQRASADDLDKMSLSQLRQLARAQGWRGTEHATKEVLVDALREHPLGAPTDAAPLAVPPVPPNKNKNKEDNRGDSMAKTDMGKVLGERIATARENGYSRKDIADASGLTQSIIWRVQAKSVVKPLEVEKLTEALDKIESGQIEPTRRGRPRGATKSGGGTKAVLQYKLDKVYKVLSEVPMNSRVAEYREAINRALDVIDNN